ncbi:hypothetical protein CEXT_69731 [Caerostris extrusa]|uniref:Uncharacterized protein n=1 Tax=Caerostris extrusa TaxID=172846 RepID=A0AAV4R261_CAEEX|nr:hypothetical protein CEXT_69731 [Caerostris extrusa]
MNTLKLLQPMRALRFFFKCPPQQMPISIIPSTIQLQTTDDLINILGDASSSMHFRAGDIRAIGASPPSFLLEMPWKARSGGIPLNGFPPALEFYFQIKSKLCRRIC